MAYYLHCLNTARPIERDIFFNDEAFMKHISRATRIYNPSTDNENCHRLRLRSPIMDYILFQESASCWWTSTSTIWSSRLSDQLRKVNSALAFGTIGFSQLYKTLKIFKIIENIWSLLFKKSSSQWLHRVFSKLFRVTLWNEVVLAVSRLATLKVSKSTLYSKITPSSSYISDLKYGFDCKKDSLEAIRKSRLLLPRLHKYSIQNIVSPSIS